jgi:hypothetical protein
VLDFGFNGRNIALNLSFQFAQESTTVQHLLDYVLGILAMHLKKEAVRAKDYSVQIAVFEKELKKWFNVGTNQPVQNLAEYKVTMIANK